MQRFLLHAASISLDRDIFPVEMNNYALQDVARECGLDDMDFDYYEDSGIGFVPQDANQDPGGQTQGAQFYYTDEIVEDDYDTGKNISFDISLTWFTSHLDQPTLMRRCILAICNMECNTLLMTK